MYRDFTMCQLRNTPLNYVNFEEFESSRKPCDFFKFLRKLNLKRYLLDFSSSRAAWAARSKALESNLYASMTFFSARVSPASEGTSGGGASPPSAGGVGVFFPYPNNHDMF